MHWTPVIICVYALHWTMVSTCKDKRRIFLLNVIDIIFSLRDIKSEQYSGDNHYVLFSIYFYKSEHNTLSQALHSKTPKCTLTSVFRILYVWLFHRTNTVAVVRKNPTIVYIFRGT